MNVYLYGGPSRTQATKSVIEGNLPVELGKTYHVDYDLGFLVVAYPNEGKATEFEFTYRLAALKDNVVGDAEELVLLPSIIKVNEE